MFTHLIRTSINIEAPPALVRQVMLDFEAYPQWSSEFVKTITVSQPGKNQVAASLNPAGPAVGAKLAVVLKGMSFAPTVVTNEEHEFAWLGSLLLPKVIFDGRHSFAFTPVSGNPNATEFVHSESFSGLLIPLLWTSIGTDTQKGFEAYNRELKQRCEALAKDAST